MCPFLNLFLSLPPFGGGFPPCPPPRPRAVSRPLESSGALRSMASPLTRSGEMPVGCCSYICQPHRPRWASASQRVWDCGSLEQSKTWGSATPNFAKVDQHGFQPPPKKHVVWSGGQPQEVGLQHQTTRGPNTWVSAPPQNRWFGVVANRRKLVFSIKPPEGPKHGFQPPPKKKQVVWSGGQPQ